MDDYNASGAQKIPEFIKKNSIVLSLFVIGLSLISYGTFEYIKPQQASMEFVSSGEAEDTQGAEVPNSLISVDVQGQVNNPGVYELEANSRIKDAIDASGGLSSDANLEYVSKSVNQAQKLVDGQKIYIPSVDEEVPVSDTVVLGSATGLIGINTSSKSKLEELPRIGPVTADKIISNRPYSELTDLVSKKVVGQSVFEEIKTLIDLN